jgi:alginate O-acetyltransferase complex protein AlgJ
MTHQSETDPPVATRVDRIVAVGFVIALLIPSIALLLGMRPESLEARDAAPAPAFGVGAMGEPATYAQLDRFVADRFPFRSLAVRLYAALDYALLGGSPNGEVVVGRDGWLFTAAEREATCRYSVAESMSSLDTAAANARSAGLDLFFIVAPDKHAIFPDLVQAGRGLGDACTDRQRAALRGALRERRPLAIDLWDDLTGARATETERPVYFAQDTHWTPFGAMIAIRRLIDAIDPSVWDPSEVREDGTAAYPTDLSRQIGLPTDEVLTRLRVRPEVKPTVTTIETDVDLRNARAIPWYHVDPGVHAVEGRTLVVYDSFFGTSEARIAPWFRESVWVHYNDLIYHPELVGDLPSFDRIVLERVERDAHSVDAATLLAPVFAANGRVTSP